ncbi:hypothetical protein GTR04_0414 [Trichophyton interdigitale]|uniref:Uncharacterized protein n=4 Tax=Trichophyton TaxID=5550 RepID=A0A9P4YL79_9EURO|nr:hypothetical protein GY632_1542 [Trichophyton interdigitale]KAF3899367.1 hypothetical protein GY631_0595 [Trichophyton interdigitale]KAG8212179.1 hypothetical protein GTR04_0414 [Trichophyton interdigitale]KDB21902.1 hypothetical protein H109_06167 [Trichophyton interdigitale MR816]
MRAIISTMILEFRVFTSGQQIARGSALAIEEVPAFDILEYGFAESSFRPHLICRCQGSAAWESAAQGEGYPSMKCTTDFIQH